MFSNIDRAISHFQNGGFVIVLDDEGRENEGDLIVSAEHMTEEQMVFMIRHTTGIICTAITPTQAELLQLSPMCEKNTDNNQTAFAVSCDSIDAGTGVSAIDRLKTVKAMCGNDPLSFRRPGHMFPLISNPLGLSARRGHTEASVALCALAQLTHKVAALSELQRDNGLMYVNLTFDSVLNPKTFIRRLSGVKMGALHFDV